MSNIRWLLACGEEYIKLQACMPAFVPFGRKVRSPARPDDDIWTCLLFVVLKNDTWDFSLTFGPFHPSSSSDSHVNPIVCALDGIMCLTLLHGELIKQKKILYLRGREAIFCISLM